jgi:hypothetical protein
MRNHAFAILFATLAGLVTPARARDGKPIAVTVIVKGAHCEDCARAIRTGLSQVGRITLRADDIRPGEEPRYFSEPVAIKIGDSEKTHIGGLAKAVSEIKTPHREKFPPSRYLVLYPSDLPDVGAYETALNSFRSELRFVNGVDAEKTGALGAFPDRGIVWLQLKESGGTDLDEILEAAKKAEVKVSLEKP